MSRVETRTHKAFKPEGMCLEDRALLSQTGLSDIVGLRFAPRTRWADRQLPSLISVADIFSRPNSDSLTHSFREAVGTSDHTGLVPLDPLWNSARVFRYGPSSAQRVWVLVPAAPSGDLVVAIHSGGFTSGEPTSSEMDPFALQALDRGATFVSVGYRLGNWKRSVADIAKSIDFSVQVVDHLTLKAARDITILGLSAGAVGAILSNDSPLFPSTHVRPTRIIAISPPLSYIQESLRLRPKRNTPITLFGTPLDPITPENSQFSATNQIADWLKKAVRRVVIFFDTDHPGQHGSAAHFPQSEAIQAAFDQAFTLSG